MDCKDRALSFGVDLELLECGALFCDLLPCYKDCPILASYPKEEE